MGLATRLATQDYVDAGAADVLATQFYANSAVGQQDILATEQWVDDNPAIGPAAYIQAVLADNPIMFWTLQDASPGPPQDSSGNNLPATAAVGIDYQFAAGPGTTDTCVLVQGGEIVSRPQVTSDVDDITLETWFYHIDVLDDTQNIIGITDADGGYTLHIRNAAESFRLRGSVKNVAFLAASTAGIPATTWTHIVMLRRAGTWMYFINGAVDTANAGTDNPNALSGGTTFINGTASISAQYAYTAIYETALSNARIQAHYDAMIP